MYDNVILLSHFLSPSQKRERTLQKVAYCELSVQPYSVFLFARQKRFFNRETIAALNYEMQQMSFIPPFPFYPTKIINSFLNSSISANHDKVDRLLNNGQIHIKRIVSLL